MRLTDIAVRNLPLPAKGQKLYYDDTLPGFGCRVSQGGTRSFFLQVGATRQFITIGRYHPDILPLAQARVEAKRILAERTLGKHRSQSISFDDAKTQFLAASGAKNRPRTTAEYERLLKRYFAFGRTQLRDITPGELNRRLDKIDAPSERSHATVCIKTFMRWAVRRHYLDHSPAEGHQATKARPRRRLLTDAEIAQIWRAATEIGWPYGSLVRLAITTGQRRGQLASLRWSWLSEGFISFPAEIMKGKKAHTIPYGKLTASVLEGIPETGELLFPARGNDTPINGWSKNFSALCGRLEGVKPFVLHDFRRYLASTMAANDVPIATTEKYLAHISGTFAGIVDVYQQHSWLPQMREACKVYETHLMTVVGRT